MKELLSFFLFILEPIGMLPEAGHSLADITLDDDADLDKQLDDFLGPETEVGALDLTKLYD